MRSNEAMRKPRFNPAMFSECAEHLLDHRTMTLYLWIAYGGNHWNYGGLCELTLTEMMRGAMLDTTVIELCLRRLQDCGLVVYDNGLVFVPRVPIDQSFDSMNERYRMKHIESMLRQYGSCRGLLGPKNKALTAFRNVHAELVYHIEDVPPIDVDVPQSDGDPSHGSVETITSPVDTHHMGEKRPSHGSVETITSPVHVDSAASDHHMGEKRPSHGSVETITSPHDMDDDNDVDDNSDHHMGEKRPSHGSVETITSPVNTHHMVNTPHSDSTYNISCKRIINTSDMGRCGGGTAKTGDLVDAVPEQSAVDHGQDAPHSPTEPADDVQAAGADSGQAPRKKPVKRASRAATVHDLPPGFVPPDLAEVEAEMQEYAGKGASKFAFFPSISIEAEAEKFLSHYTETKWHQSRNKPIVNWQQAAQRWLRQWPTFNPTEYHSWKRSNERAEQHAGKAAQRSVAGGNGRQHGQGGTADTVRRSVDRRERWNRGSA